MVISDHETLLEVHGFVPVPGAALLVEEQVAVIFAGVKGYLDKIALIDIGRFEAGLLDMLRGSGKDILNTIRDEQKISDETDAKLRAVIESFAKSFA